MYARRKVSALSSFPKDQQLARDVLGTAETELERDALEKDLPLVEAALETDSIVVSRDETVRKLFQRAALIVPSLRPLVWVNPVTDEHLLGWLAGEPCPSVLTLGAAARSRPFTGGD